MFEKYTDQARRAVFFARYEAVQLGVSAIDTEHLLLGLLREEPTILSRFFPTRVSVEAIRQRIQRRVIFRRQMPVTAEIPLSVEAKQVLRQAAEEAALLSHGAIRPEHFLLGLLREDNSLCARVLRENGIAYAVVRQDVEHGAEG